MEHGEDTMDERDRDSDSDWDEQEEETAAAVEVAGEAAGEAAATLDDMAVRMQRMRRHVEGVHVDSTLPDARALEGSPFRAYRFGLRPKARARLAAAGLSLPEAVTLSEFSAALRARCRIDAQTGSVSVDAPMAEALGLLADAPLSPFKLLAALRHLTTTTS